MKLIVALSALVAAALAVQVEVEELSKTIRGNTAARLSGALGLVQEAAGIGASVSMADSEGSSYYKINEESLYDGRSVRVAQSHAGFDVFGYGAAVFEAASGETSVYAGQMVHGLEGVAEEGDYEAMAERQAEVLASVKAQHNIGNKHYNHDLALKDNVQPIIYINEETLEAQKAYHVQFVDTSSKEPSFPNVIVSEDGELLEKYEGLNTRGPAVANGPGGNKKTGKIQYKDLSATEVGGNKCILENKNVRTINLNNGYSRSKNTPHQFSCYTQSDKQINGAYAPMNDAHHYGGIVFKAYQERYKRQPLKTLPLRLKVHYGRSYENAFWDGSSMTFGDGRRTFYPLVALDVVAHEVSHGVTEQTSNLQYRGQSGGLNEAFSDMAGKYAESVNTGYDPKTFDWGIGSTITKGKNALRCMDNPPCDGRSIDDARKYRGQNVHYTSGVFNKAFYLMSTKSAKGIQDAFDIMYIANTRYYSRNTNFNQAAALALKAAAHLKDNTHLPDIDHSHLDLNQLIAVFKQVGISCSGSGDNYSCKNL
jgi:Zn-dependent metalloprotease